MIGRGVVFLTEEDGRVKSSLAEATCNGGSHMRTLVFHPE